MQDVCQDITPGRGPKYSATGIPCLKTRNVGNVLVDKETEEFVSYEYSERNDRLRVPADSVLMTLSGAGSIGRVGVYLGSERPFTNQHLVWFKLTQDLDSGFMAAYLSTWWGERAIEQGISGSTGQLWLNQDHIREIPVTTPESSVQRAIGNKVRKAERLREISASLRESASGQIENLYGKLPSNGTKLASWVASDVLQPERLDAWFHKPYYLSLAMQFRDRDDVIPVNNLCRRITASVDFSKWPSTSFDYYEIGEIKSGTGEAVGVEVNVVDAPSRAKTLVRAGDVLVSTVRPNLKAIAQISPDHKRIGVATSGFCVLRAETEAIGAYIRACLVTDAGTHQLMRWSTGGTYPAIDHSVPLNVLVPNPGEEQIEVIGKQLLLALDYTHQASSLVEDAKTDVESLIEGSLDLERLLGEGESTGRWLEENPVPSSKGRKHS
ncbi:MAG: restriction endonuclease subunit S [Candidatus Thiodiazotropha sp. (ex Ctena orbiculata)]|uniref:Restriction endonuclease subunit S n=1 Tax=Candidatus Thiodiazotropha taylori TaxID=2792791 RepID=A0A944MDL7_9GAMM|nr:restriction endonuclease subunit S [Candidatus Thiodiazotropha taylori]